VARQPSPRRPIRGIRGRGRGPPRASPAVMKQIGDSFAAPLKPRSTSCWPRGASMPSRWPGLSSVGFFPMRWGFVETGRTRALLHLGRWFQRVRAQNELRRPPIERSRPHQASVQEQCQRDNSRHGGFGACIHARSMRGEIPASEGRCWYARALAGIDTTVNGIGAALYASVLSEEWGAAAP